MSADRLLAIAAIAIAVAGVALALWVVVWMRRVRRAQSALLSGGPVADLVEFAVGMQARQEIVEARAEELAALVERARSDVAEALQRVGPAALRRLRRRRGPAVHGPGAARRDAATASS